MGKHTRHRDRRSVAATVATAAVAMTCAALGTGLIIAATTGQPPAPLPAPAAQHITRHAEDPSASPALAPLPRSKPLALDIPAIDLHTRRLVSLGLTPDDRLQTPQSWDAVGWYTGGPAPGQRGPAVMAGHVDSDTGPAVFYRLSDLAPGDAVTIARADRTKVVFTVHAVETYPKDAFPTDAVYGPTQRPELRLITCGGTFDEATQHYRDNTIAYAHLTAVR